MWNKCEKELMEEREEKEQEKNRGVRSRKKCKENWE